MRHPDITAPHLNPQLPSAVEQEAVHIRSEAQEAAQRDLGAAKQLASGVLAAAQEVGNQAAAEEEALAAAKREVLPQRRRSGIPLSTRLLS